MYSCDPICSVCKSKITISDIKAKNFEYFDFKLDNEGNGTMKIKHWRCSAWRIFWNNFKQWVNEL